MYADRYLILNRSNCYIPGSRSRTIAGSRPIYRSRPPDVGTGHRCVDACVGRRTHVRTYTYMYIHTYTYVIDFIRVRRLRLLADPRGAGPPTPVLLLRNGAPEIIFNKFKMALCGPGGGEIMEPKWLCYAKKCRYYFSKFQRKKTGGHQHRTNQRSRNFFWILLRIFDFFNYNYNAQVRLGTRFPTFL